MATAQHILPKVGQENGRINLWLFQGNPSDGEVPEIVITAFEFIPRCKGDFNDDGDVDGSDLAAFADNAILLDLSLFAEEFGITDCP